MVCFKYEVVYVAIFGDSPDFLDSSFSAKIQKSGFFGQVLFSEKAKFRSFGQILLVTKHVNYTAVTQVKVMTDSEEYVRTACEACFQLILYYDKYKSFISFFYDAGLNVG